MSKPLIDKIEAAAGISVFQAEGIGIPVGRKKEDWRAVPTAISWRIQEEADFERA
jgi:hypothetical protein